MYRLRTTRYRLLRSALCLSLYVSASVYAQHGTRDGEWRFNGGDGGSKVEHGGHSGQPAMGMVIYSFNMEMMLIIFGWI